MMNSDFFTGALLGVAVGAILVAFLSFLAKPYFRDASFSMDIKTDELTGCQYVSTYNGGITPRLDQNGKHICEMDKAGDDFK